MKKSISIPVFAGFAATLAVAFTLADDKKPAPEAPKCEGLERMKSLAGEWTVVKADNEGMKGSVTYRVTAGGSAVLETLFPGSDHEMISVYYAEGEDLAMTHYCMLHNRPSMRAKKSSDPKKISLVCAEQKGLKCDADTHMHEATITFSDNDHVKSEWTLYEKGKAAGTHAFELERKK